MADAPVEFGKQDEGRGCVARRVYQKRASLPLLGGEGNGVYDGGDLGFEWLGLVDLDIPPEMLATEISAFRVYAGYAGWSSGQLERELAQGAWYVVDPAPGDAFTLDPERTWRAVLRRQRGELALLSTFPEDPAMN